MIGDVTAHSLAPLFWRPSRQGVLSAWYGHVPFAHWLVANHRPSSIVELGSHYGVSYAAFCEAVVREQLDTRCIAVDTWQGDEHAGFYGDEVYNDVVRFHDGRYSGFSTLLRTTFDDALTRVPEASIDLLHIDGRHRYEDCGHDFQSWLPKLAPGAIVLFHDTNVRWEDFGVWRLWAELKGRYPSFEFLHAYGLGVLAPSGPVGSAAAGLFQLQDDAAVNAVRERFSVLGERWSVGWLLEEEKQRHAEERQRSGRMGGELAEVRAWANRAQAEVDRLFPAYRDLLDQHRAARAELARARHDIAALRSGQSVAAQDADRGELLRRYNAVAEESEALWSAAQGYIDALCESQRVLLGSTSWRITAPLRALRGARVPEVPDIQLPRPAHAAVARPDMPAVRTAPFAAEDLDRKKALFISGEDHTPGHVYRILRMMEAARALGYEARWMSAIPVGPDDLQGLSLVVLWRVAFSAHVRGIIDLSREQGALVVFDVDDLMFRPELAVIDIIDGIRSQQFSELNTQAFFTQIGRTLAACDIVTCPTEELASQARRLGRPAHVVPNGFDAASLAASRRAMKAWADSGDDLLRIGYAAGSRTHQRDFKVAAPAVARVLREIPQARLVMFRDGSSGEGLVLMEEFPEFADLQDRIEWRNLVPLDDLPSELARFAVNIAPLEADNPFCEAKSELKYFESALCGVPTIASPSGPFRRAVTDGVTGMLADTEEEWHAALSTLLGDAALRRRMAKAAYVDSLGRFGPEARVDSFGMMLTQARGGAAGAAAFQQARYRASLPRVTPPTLPDCDILFAADRGGEAAVTIVVPVYNYADYVLEALYSAAAQTLQPLDLVVVEDASPDDSGRMVLDWVHKEAARFNRVQVIRHRANAGLGFARNTGFAAAETPYVLPLDADNRLRPKACARLLAELERSGAAFAYPTIQKFGDEDDIKPAEPYTPLRLQCGNYIDAMALIRLSAWAASGGYDHVRHGWEDYDLWCRFAERGFFGVAVPETLADYRVHARSMLRTETEIRDNRRALVADMQHRHPWLDLGN